MNQTHKRMYFALNKHFANKLHINYVCDLFGEIFYIKSIFTYK